MDIRQLQTFLVVARLLNFRAAAEELNYSQSTVSDHIRNLEQELNVKLFERLGRKVFLNEQGKKLISSAERMINDAEEIHRLFDNDEKIEGTLKIGAAETLCGFWLPPLLKEYSKLYPNVQIILKMADCLRFPEMLETNVIDVAFGLHDESEQQQLSQIDLFQDSTIFVAAPDHPLTAMKKITMHELENQAFILTEAESGYSWELKKLLQDLNVKTSSIMEFNSLEAIKQCVKNGLGITLLPSITVENEIQRGELVILPVEINQIVSLFEAYSEKKLIQPTFVIDFPKESSPLCKSHRDNPDLIERFEPYAYGVELGNAYSELNDPLKQRILLHEQASKLRAGLETASPMDEEFAIAIDTAMPPTGGLGIGIDRMIMFLTGSYTIKDVIAFPLIKR